MSMFSVDIVNQETIKPSTPTPPHLTTLNISLLDQLEPPRYIPQILFYSASPFRDAIVVARLKKSLSQALTLFYPFAGRIMEDNQYVRCNDRGVNLFEARVHTQMDTVLANPITDYLLPFIPDHHKLHPTALLSIQINVFNCGGIALCAYINHQIADAASLMLFLNTWAAITRGATADEIVCPNFCLSSLPSLGLTEFVAPHETQEKLVSKRFVFSSSEIAALQAKCCTKLYRPTRAEAVTAYLWRCAMSAAETTTSVVMPTLNLRTRMDPPLSVSSVGNLILGLLATSATNSLPALPYLTGRLHESVRKVDRDFVRKLEVDNGVLKLYDSYKQEMMEMCSEGEQVRLFGITSFCRFPLYEADFGWGKPEWATILNLVCPDVIMLTDTKCGTGIQAWVTLNEQRMGKFECNSDLIAFSSRL